MRHLIAPLPAVTFVNPASITYAAAVVALLTVIIVGIVMSRGAATPRGQRIDNLARTAAWAIVPVMLVSGILTADTVTSDRLHANAAYIKAEYGVTLAPEDAAPNAANPASGRDADGKKHAYILRYEDGGIVLYTADLHRVPQVTR